MAEHFRSFDGKARKFMVEGVGGASWYAEYNVLDRIVGALLRPLLLFRHPHRRQSRDARPAQRVAPLRLPDPHDLSCARRLHERAQLPDHVGVQQFSDKRDLGAKGLRAG